MYRNYPEVKIEKSNKEEEKTRWRGNFRNRDLRAESKHSKPNIFS